MKTATENQATSNGTWSLIGPGEYNINYNFYANVLSSTYTFVAVMSLILMLLWVLKRIRKNEFKGDE